MWNLNGRFADRLEMTDVAVLSAKRIHLITPNQFGLNEVVHNLRVNLSDDPGLDVFTTNSGRGSAVHTFRYQWLACFE